MESKNNGMFTGFSKVFGFTAKQNVKGKGFKLSTIFLGLVIAVGFALISILMAVSQNGDSGQKSDINDIISSENGTDLDVYYINNTSLDDGYINGITSAEAFGGSTFTKVEASEQSRALENTNDYLEGKLNGIVMELKENDDKITVNYYLPYETGLTEETAQWLGTSFDSYVEYIRSYEIAGLDGDEMELYNADVFSQSLAAGEEASDLGVMLARLLVPMLFSLILYMMILLYGQNITKIVVAEKSSKLMETLLTSVKPYAIISGKILAVSGIAVMQMIIWIFAAAGGYIAGGYIAEYINPGYTNYLSLIIDIISNSSDAFSIGAIVIAVLMLIIGFLMYSVLAGLVAATVDKMEDISSAMSLFQIPVIIGFIGSYFVQMSENETMHLIVRYCPVTSPFSVPADIMVGNMTIIEGAASLVIVAAVTFGLILLTGKIYKGKLFNRH